MLPITVDIETLPDMRPGAKDAFIAAAAESFKAPSTLTKEQAAIELGLTDKDAIKFTSKDKMIADWTERFRAERAPAQAEEDWRKTSFDASKGQILMIGAASHEGEPIVFYNESEYLTLVDFFNWLSDEWKRNNLSLPTFIGHNIVGFDLRFILQRAIILEVEPPMFFPRNPRPWDAQVFDTMTEWAGVGNRIKLDDLCKILGIEGKGGVDGSMVYDMYMDGKVGELMQYCASDVEITRAAWRRISFTPKVEQPELADVPL